MAKSRLRQKGMTLTELAVTITMIGTTALVGTGIYYGFRALNKYVNEPVVERVNVIKGSEAELFIERDGKKFYAEIDGKPVTEYLHR